MAQTGAKVAVAGILAVLLLGAVYLYTVRGQALLIDFAAMTRGLLCF
jgi:hypothetical protein